MSAGLLTEMHAHLGAGSAEPDDEPDAKRLKVIQPSGLSAGLQAALQVAQPSLQHPSPSNRCLGTRMVHSYAQAIVPLYLQGPSAAGVKVTFLGTGSAEPDRHRGCAAIHIQCAENAGMLLDCGEGTWGAFLHFWGPEEALRKVKQLKVIWISHRHADHMMGLAGVLTARGIEHGSKQDQLMVVGPANVRNWLKEVWPLCRHHFGYHFATNPMFMANITTAKKHARIVQQLGELVGITCFVKLCSCSAAAGAVQWHET